MLNQSLLTAVHDYQHDKVCDLAEEWNQRLTLSNPNFVNRYINQKIWMLIHFRIGKSQEFRRLPSELLSARWHELFFAHLRGVGKGSRDVSWPSLLFLFRPRFEFGFSRNGQWML